MSVIHSRDHEGVHMAHKIIRITQKPASISPDDETKTRQAKKLTKNAFKKLL